MNKFLKGIFALVLVFSIHAYGCDAQTPIEQLGNKLTISDTTFNFSEADGYSTITIIGTIKNQSLLHLERPVVEVKYFDQQGKKIDVLTRTMYEIVIPANEEVDFRIRDQAVKPKEYYVSSKARIVSADEKCLRKTNKKKRPLWLQLLVSWSPMLILFGFLYLVIRKTNGKKSPQKVMVSLMEKQNELLDRNAKATERLADSAEKGLGPD